MNSIRNLTLSSYEEELFDSRTSFLYCDWLLALSIQQQKFILWTNFEQDHSRCEEIMQTHGAKDGVYACCHGDFFSFEIEDYDTPLSETERNVAGNTNAELLSLEQLSLQDTGNSTQNRGIPEDVINEIDDARIVQLNSNLVNVSNTEDIEIDIENNQNYLNSQLGANSEENGHSLDATALPLLRNPFRLHNNSTPQNDIFENNVELNHQIEAVDHQHEVENTVHEVENAFTSLNTDSDETTGNSVSYENHHSRMDNASFRSDWMSYMRALGFDTPEHVQHHNNPHESNRQFSCVVCLEEYPRCSPYNEGPFLHSICEKCTGQLLRNWFYSGGEIDCPICRRKLDIFEHVDTYIRYITEQNTILNLEHSAGPSE